MYKLYGYIPELTRIQVSFDEEKIIDTIYQYLDKVAFVHFIIVLQLEKKMIPYRSICSEQEFYEYVEDYKKEKNKTYCRKRKK